MLRPRALRSQVDWGQCAPLPPGKKPGSCGSGWRDATVVACWRDGSFRVRVHGQAWEFDSSDEKADYRLEPKGVTHLDFASPRTHKGRRLHNKSWRYPPAPRRQGASAATSRPTRATQPAGAARRSAAVDSDDDSDDGSEAEEAEEVRCPETGERVELRVDLDGSGGGRKGKRKVEEWQGAGVDKVFRGRAFEARLLNADATVQGRKTKYNVADVRVTWRWSRA